MITITLNNHDRQQLEHTFKTTTDRRLRDRCQAILMADRGRRHHQIADDLRVAPRTLHRWLNAYHTENLDGLRIHGAPGHAPRIPESLAPEIGVWVKHGSAGCGLDRANWTAAELATCLYQTRGIAVSERTMRAFCTTHGIRPYRPTYPYLKGDPAQQETARQALETCKKSRSQ